MEPKSIKDLDKHHQPKRITPLTPGVASKLTSSIVINDLDDVVIGLILNCLDARSYRIECNLNFAEGSCVIQDDGAGIAVAEFAADGTSKLFDSISHGRSGTFLSSLAALSLVKITSRTSSNNTVGNLVLHRSHAINRSVADASSLAENLGKHGTRVSVQNLFADFPVRTKRYDPVEECNVTSKKWTALKHRLVSVLMAWPFSTVVLLNEESTRLRLQLRGGDERSALTPAIEAKSRQDNVSDRELRLLIQAGYVPPDTSSSWVAISGSNHTISVRGAISLDPVPTKQCQFISIGCKPVWSKSSQSELFDLVNRLFVESSFGIDEEAHNNSYSRSRDNTTGRNGHEDNVKSRPKDCANGVDRWPMFYFRVAVKKHADGSTEKQPLQLQPSFHSVARFLTALTNQWLTQQHFKHEPLKNYGVFKKTEELARQKTMPLDNSNLNISPRTDRTECLSGRGTLAMQPSQLLHGMTRRPRPDSITSSWSKVKTGSSKGVQSRHLMTGLDASGVGLKNWEVSDSESRDPISDSRTTIPATTEHGKKAPLETRLCSAHVQTSHSYQQSRTTRISILKSKAATGLEEKSMKTMWPSEILRRWKNPVFKQPENLNGRKTGIAFAPESISHDCSNQKNVSAADSRTALSAKTRRFCTRDLKDAHVIAQVDFKFILLKVVAASAHGNHTEAAARKNTILVILDQHAADERCVFEQLIRDLCVPTRQGPPKSITEKTSRAGAAVARLATAISFEMSTMEASLLEQCSSHFVKWGIKYTVEGARDQRSMMGSSKGVRVDVHSLPSGIVERCSSEPDILLNLLRSEAWKREESGIAQTLDGVQPEGDAEKAWLRQIGDCPKGIVDMLASRACRSAIMFNDELSKEACHDLVARLATCALPFQCAHGRPTFVPLVSLGTPDVQSRDVAFRPEEPRGDFITAYRRWSGRDVEASRAVALDEEAKNSKLISLSVEV